MREFFFSRIPLLTAAAAVLTGFILLILLVHITARRLKASFTRSFDLNPRHLVRLSLVTAAVILTAITGHILLPLLTWPVTIKVSLNKLLTIAAISVSAILLSRLLGEIIIRNKPVDQSSAAASTTSIFRNLITTTILAITLLIILQTLGISITPLLTALGVGGLAVALALQETLSNLFAGFALILSHKIRPGEFIRLDTGEEGIVVDTNWRHTKLRAIQNNLFLIPNSKLASSILTSFDRPETELTILVPVGVDYDSDLCHVERIVIEVGREVMTGVEGGVPSWEPVVRFNAFNDSSIGFNAVLRAQEYTAQFLVRHEFIKRLKARFDAEGIVIPFPIRTLAWRDPPPQEKN